MCSRILAPLSLVTLARHSQGVTSAETTLALRCAGMRSLTLAISCSTCEGSVFKTVCQAIENKGTPT